MLTVAQAADQVGVSEKTLRREIADGRLATTRIRGCIRIAEHDLGEYLKQCRSESTATAGRSEYSMPGLGLAKLLGLEPTPSTLSESGNPGSRIVRLDARRATRSKKP